MLTWPIISTVLIAVASIAIVLWIFRPNSNAYYNKVSKIPLRDE